jgi:NAD(P)-dependent dehydrogenase (short-subunit alcohol dehydrogenase family)
MTTLADRSMLVTGGGSGMGLDAAKRLASEGAHVTICGRTAAKLEMAANDIQNTAAPGVQVNWVVADMSVEEDVRKAVAAAAVTGRLDGVFASAGGSAGLGPVATMDLASFRATFDLNVVSTMLTIKHVAPVMARNGGGSIVAVSSIAGISTHRLMAAYCVAKAGIDMLVRVAADELGPSKIRVNSIRPGLVDTGLVERITAGGPLLDDYIEKMPLGRVGTVDDTTALARFLLGPESSWITGQTIGVDGGHHLRGGPNYGLMLDQFIPPEVQRGLLPDPATPPA